MLTIHELEEVIIGDITPFSTITQEEKREMGKKAVENILEGLTKKEDYIQLIEEFEQRETNEACFAKMCDKLEASIQAKLYEEQKNISVSDSRNKKNLEDSRITTLIEQGEDSIADFFIEYDRHIFNSSLEFTEVLNFIKENNLQDIIKE